MKTQQKKVRVLTTLSSCIEFYDFSLIVFLAPVLSQVFYPSHTQHQGLTNILGIFAFGYLSRIIGAIIFGDRGDCRGRKSTLMFSIAMMAIATFAIAILPSYDRLGYAGAYSLAILRVIQGLALGGEVPGAIVFCSEHNNAKRRGYSTSLIVFGVTFGNVLASGLFSLLTYLMPHTQFVNWGWRIMFVVGGILSTISLMMRYSVHETPYFKNISHYAQKEKRPILQLYTQHFTLVVKGFFLTSLAAICISIFYQIIELQPYLHVMPNTINIFVFASFVFISAGAVLVGTISDKIGRLPLVQLSCAVFTLFPLSYFLFHSTSLILTFMPLLIGSALILGVYTAVLTELFPTNIRYSGVALCYNLGFTICGGLTPVILQHLNQSGIFMSMSVLPCLVAVPLLLFSTFFWRDYFNSPLVNHSP